MQAPGGPSEDPTGGFAHGGWLPQFFDAEVGEAIGSVFDRDYDLLLGRRTYDIFAAYWPYVGREATEMGKDFEPLGHDDGEAEAAAMGEAFTRASKYVLTRGEPDLGWANSHKLGSIADVSALKQGDGRDLVIQGSSTIYPALLEAGLIDRLTVMTFPVILGGGKRLFGDGTPARTMRLVDHKVGSAGAIIATYEAGGKVTQGWAGPQSTSDRETLRQRRIADGSW